MGVEERVGDRGAKGGALGEVEVETDTDLFQ